MWALNARWSHLQQIVKIMEGATEFFFNLNKKISAWRYATAVVEKDLLYIFNV